MKSDLIAFFGCGVGFLGLWLWMQKRLKTTQEELRNAFKAMSFDVLEQSSSSFLQLARTHLEKYQEGAQLDLSERQRAIAGLLEPVQAAIQQVSAQHRELEQRREGAYSALHKQLDLMIASDRELRQETSQLAGALRSPQIGGSWGQVHLRRVVELAGLVNQCDFSEQATVTSDGKLLRPDLIVHLPGQRQIAIDAKTPLAAYLDAAELTDSERRKQRFQDHALAVRKHIKDLSTKEYWKALDTSPEYTILFLPAEAFFSAALQADPTLIEVGADQNIVVATPTTLIAILRAVAYSWKQEGLSKSAQEIAKLGAELYDRLGTLTEYWGKVGRNLTNAVQAYNQSVVSLETRALVSARKLKECASISQELPALQQIDQIARDS